jgi:hypothetical protein
MQHFDSEIEKMIRSGVISMETGLAFSTNPGNLRLELSDFTEPAAAPRKRAPAAAPDLEIVR